MPNGQKKSGKSAHSNKQRAREREEMNTKIQDITKTYEDQMEFHETRVKELTEEIAKTKNDMIKENEVSNDKLSKSRAEHEELQNEHIKIMNKSQEKDKVIANLQKQGARDCWDIVKYKAVIMKYEPDYFDTESESEEEEKKMCVLCDKELNCAWGHNGAPLCKGRVCDKCNKDKIIPYRMESYKKKPNVMPKNDMKKLKEILSDMGIDIDNKRVEVITLQD